MPVETDRARNLLRIPAQFPGRSVLARYLMQESFVAPLIRAYAISSNYRGPEGRFHFVLLNMARSGEWSGMEPELLAHEYGHLWLDALDYASLSFEASALACAATHASDIVQHILIRQEARRRGFDVMRFWIRIQEKWLDEQAQAQAAEASALEPCERMQLFSHWMDAELGLSEAQWGRWREYRARVERYFEGEQEGIEQLKLWLKQYDVSDRSYYEVAMAKIWRFLHRLH